MLKGRLVFQDALNAEQQKKKRLDAERRYADQTKGSPRSRWTPMQSGPIKSTLVAPWSTGCLHHVTAVHDTRNGRTAATEGIGFRALGIDGPEGVVEEFRQ
ncbi:hypothetical protein Taro_011410 [Colocasia esculenta]|uniref:Uncharacterized protein n=1 Tax=Colocasia esculenta TaxID=4460 RepID=A0A843U670_COLES|nr:hypothetical protein [Colocasia esculenta]